MQRILNPVGSAYRSEIAGLMEALRVLTNEESQKFVFSFSPQLIPVVKEYHKTYYTPYNLELIIAGRIETIDILETLQSKVETSILKHGELPGILPPGWKRPFLETATAQRTPLKTNIEESVEFPEQDESHGELVMALSGPSPTDFLTLDVSRTSY
jgi:Zn-dependent M16 (insulinase) family peptidase